MFRYDPTEIELQENNTKDYFGDPIVLFCSFMTVHYPGLSLMLIQIWLKHTETLTSLSDTCINIIIFPFSLHLLRFVLEHKQLPHYNFLSSLGAGQ